MTSPHKLMKNIMCFAATSEFRFFMAKGVIQRDSVAPIVLHAKFCDCLFTAHYPQYRPSEIMSGVCQSIHSSSAYFGKVRLYWEWHNHIRSFQMFSEFGSKDVTHLRLPQLPFGVSMISVISEKTANDILMT